jgi:dethiobiotin synthetase
MSKRFLITATDTDVGKTVFSAALMLALDEAGKKPHYWKPVQCGITESVDTKHVQTLTKLPDERFLPEAYIFSQPFSPHRAAELDETQIDIQKMNDKSIIPDCDGTLIIEGAGGLMVPLTRKNLQINVYKKWKVPAILCARTSLGTINHTLLSLEALWSRRIPIKGIAFIGDENEDTINTIKEFSNVRILGRMPSMELLSDQSLLRSFKENFNVEDFVS